MAIADPLSLTLASLSWPGWRTGAVKLDETLGTFNVDAGRIAIYASRHGTCQVEVDDASDAVTSITMASGDFLVLPQGNSHRIVRPQGSPEQTGENVPAADSRGSYGNGRDSSRVSQLVYGHFFLEVPEMNPLKGQISNQLFLPRQAYSELAELDPLIEQVQRENRLSRPGASAIAGQLVQVVFHQLLRAFVSQVHTAGANDGEDASIHAPLVQDPLIGLVVGLLHSQPETPWTVARLARWVNMSRSAFSERFREVVGRPPLQFLTELRMAKACHLLAESELGVKQIATMVGYESPSSFTNAFKRWKGVSPATFRQNHECRRKAV